MPNSTCMGFRLRGVRRLTVAFTAYLFRRGGLDICFRRFILRATDRLTNRPFLLRVMRTRRLGLARARVRVDRRRLDLRIRAANPPRRRGLATRRNLVITAMGYDCSFPQG